MEKLEELAEELETFVALDDALQTFEAKGITQKLAWMYESIVAVEWGIQYGEKYEKLAEIYLEDTWKLRKLGDSMKTVLYFDEVV